MAKGCRKPFGQGKLAQQRNRREDIAKTLSSKILQILDLDIVESTGCIFPRKLDLRMVKNRKYMFLKKQVGRIFTMKVCVAVVRKVVASLPFSLTKDPRSTLDDFIRAQAKRLQTLARKSKRVSLKKKTMDNMETQAYEFWLQCSIDCIFKTEFQNLDILMYCESLQKNLPNGPAFFGGTSSRLFGYPVL